MMGSRIPRANGQFWCKWLQVYQMLNVGWFALCKIENADEILGCTLVDSWCPTAHPCKGIVRRLCFCKLGLQGGDWPGLGSKNIYVRCCLDKGLHIPHQYCKCWYLLTWSMLCEIHELRHFCTRALSAPSLNESNFEMRSVIFDILVSIPSWNLSSTSASLAKRKCNPQQNWWDKCFSEWFFVLTIVQSTIRDLYLICFAKFPLRWGSGHCHLQHQDWQ